MSQDQQDDTNNNGRAVYPIDLNRSQSKQLAELEKLLKSGKAFQPCFLEKLNLFCASAQGIDT